jgi:ABC-type antimicrobial peptide transport system permease subunit
MGVRTLPDLMAQSMARTSFTLILLGIAGGVVLILGVVGVYGVISYGVSRRSRELGLRMALGARAEHVRRMVLRRGLILASVGAAIGPGLASGLTRLMSSQLYGVSPVDAPTYSRIGGGGSQLRPCVASGTGRSDEGAPTAVNTIQLEAVVSGGGG